MTRTPVSTLKVRAVLTSFVSVILLTLFAVIPRIITGFSNYLGSGTSIFLPLMEPINIFWYLPTEFQVLPITAQQFADICIFAFISNNIWACLYQFYMKIKKNLTFKDEMTDQFGTESSPMEGSISVLRFDLVHKPAIGTCYADKLNLPHNWINRLRTHTIDYYTDETQERYLPKLTITTILRAPSYLSFNNPFSQFSLLLNSACNSLGSDFFNSARPGWDSAPIFNESPCALIGGIF